MACKNKFCAFKNACMFAHVKSNVRNIFCNELLFLAGVDTGASGCPVSRPTFDHQKINDRRGIFPAHPGSITDTYLREIVKVRDPHTVASQELMFKEIKKRVALNHDMRTSVIGEHHPYPEKRKIVIKHWTQLRKSFIEEFDARNAEEVRRIVRQNLNRTGPKNNSSTATAKSLTA